MNFVRLIRVEAERLLREIRYYKFDQMISFFDLLLICLGIFTGMGRDYSQVNQSFMPGLE